MPQTRKASGPDSVRLSRITRGLLYAAAIALVFFVLSPLLRSGYFGDDTLNSLHMPATHAIWHTTVFAVMAKVALRWVTVEGRFFPLAFLQYALFYVLNGSLTAYKWYLILMVIGNVVLFGIFCRTLTNSWPVEILSILAISVVFQFRLFHDAIMSFGGLLQVVTFLTLGSLLLFMRYIRDRRKSNLVLSVALYAISLITYEVGVPFVLLFFLIAWLYPSRHRARDALKLTLPYIVASAAAVLTTIALRVSFHLALSGGDSSGRYVPSTNPFAALTLIAKQVLATVPLSFYSAVAFAQSRGLIPPPRVFASPFAYASGDPVIFMLVVVLSGGAMLLLTRALSAQATISPPPSNMRAAAAVGACLLVLPAVLMSLSPVLQNDVRWGEGYLPVYISSFGMALLIALLASVLIQRSRGTWLFPVVAIALAALLAFTAATTYENNRVVVEYFNRTWRYPRSIVQDALGRGVLAEAPADSRVYVASTRMWETSEFYDVYAHRTDVDLFNLRSSETTPSTVGDPRPTRSLDSSPSYFVESASAGEGNGFVMTGPIISRSTGPIGGGSLQYKPTRVYLGVRSTTPGAVETPALATTDTVTTLASVGVDERNAKMIGSGADWALYQLDLPTPRVINY